MPSGHQRNLVLVHTPRHQARSDFETIRIKLAERAPEIEVFIVDNFKPATTQIADRPTLVFSAAPLARFRPGCGKVYAGAYHTKMQETDRLREAGVRVPDTIMVEPSTRLDPATWGRFTVVKPNQGARGVGVRLVSTEDVRWPARNAERDIPTLAQKFIDTGPFAQSHRVLTVLGRPICSTTNRTAAPRSFDLTRSLALMSRSHQTPPSARGS